MSGSSGCVGVSNNSNTIPLFPNSRIFSSENPRLPMAIVMSEINDVRIGFLGFDSMFGSIMDRIDETHLFHTCSLFAQDGSIIIIEAFGSCSRFFHKLFYGGNGLPFQSNRDLTRFVTRSC